MRIKISIVIVLALTLFSVTIAAAGPPVHEVLGGGKLDLEDGYETLAFVVQIDKEGVVTGEGEFHKHNLAPWSSHWEPNCLSVDGDMAWIGFITTRTTYPNLPPIFFESTMQLQVLDEGVRISPAIPIALLPGYEAEGYEVGNDCSDQGDLFSLESKGWLSHIWQKGKFRIH